MRRHFSWIAVGFLIVWQFACGGGTFKQSPKQGSSDTPSANISISPTSATVGSPDLTLTILGSNNFTFFNGHWHSTVLWSQAGVDTALLTSFVGSSQLTAIVPAALLASAGTGNVRVETWDN